MKFEYGAAMWAQGTEGGYLQDGKTLTVLEQYATLYPNRMQENYPPFVTLDLYNNHDKFVEELAKLELDSIRTSISWSRLFPDGINLNTQAVQFYKTFFEKIRATDTKIWITLYWFDMPLFQEDKGGFLNQDVRDQFVKYCKTAIELFDQYIEIFYVFNEPQVDLEMKYLTTACYPFETDMYKVYQSQIYMLECQAKIIKYFKENKFESRIGTVIDINTVHPRSNSSADLEAANRAKLLYYRPWIDVSINGAYPQELIKLLATKDITITISDEQKKLFAENRIEVLGINYYFPIRVKVADFVPNPEKQAVPEDFFSDYKMPGAKYNKDRGWEIYPQGIYEVLMDIKDNYGNIETYITENGIGVQGEKPGSNGIVEDNYRIDFALDSLNVCEQAIADGANLRGYHIWSLVDLWSPSNQFLNKYGLIHFDNETFKFKIKESGLWYSDYIKAKRMEKDV